MSGYRRTPKAVRSPTRADLAWAAGFIEGEGSFGSGDRGGCISVGQIQRWPLDRLLEMFGGRVGQYSKKTGHPVFHYWRAHGARARGVALTLYSFLSPVRQAQCRKLLQDWLGSRRPCFTRNNKRQNTTSGFKGVGRLPGKRTNSRWLAKLVVNKKTVYSKTFPTEREAALAYNIAAMEHLGPTAYFNQVF